MRTLDRRFLAAPPADGSTTAITMSRRIPPSIPVENNPDGSRPVITFKAEGRTYMDVFTVLQAMPEGPDLALTFLEGSLTEEQENELSGLEDEQLVEKASELANLIQTPFRTFACTVVATVAAEGEQSQVEVKLEMTAPSIAHGVAGLRSMVSSKNLMQVAISLCPETDDDDDCSTNDVLVIG